MAYQDDFRNKVIAALKAKNLAVDISQEATQKAIVEEAQNVASSEARTMSSEEMTQVLQDVASQLAKDNGQTFTAQSADFTAFKDNIAGGGPTGPGGSYSGGGIAASTANKDIIIIPANGGLGAAGSATSVNSLSQIDFKHIANPNAYAAFDPNEVKASLFNWAERITGNTFDTPVLGLGGAWGGVSYAPTSSWGVGTSTGSGIGGSINTDKGFGQIIYFKPATSTIYASLFNDLGLDTSYTNRSISITNYQPAVPGAFPTAGLAITFGGIGNSGDLVIQGAVNEAQSNTIKFLSSLTVSNSTATDTLILGLSSAGIASTQWFVGGTGQTSNIYNLSAAASSFAVGDLFYSAGVGHTTLARLPVGANNTYLASTGSTPFWTNTIAANTVSVNPAVNSATLYPLLNNAAGSGAAVSTDVDFSVDPGANILRYSNGTFYVGTAVSSPQFTSSGDISIKPGANSTTAIQLDNFAGTPVLNVDTTNSRIGINNQTSPAYSLDVSGPVHASSGSSYLINGKVVLNETTLGNSVNSIGTITTGTWAATAITTLYGGIGNLTTFAVGDLLYASSSTIISKLADVATGSVLASGGVGAIPFYLAQTALNVGFATTSANQYIAANTNSGANYVVFAPAVSSGLSGVGLSVTNQSNQLQYNPTNQQLIVPNITGTAFTATNLTGTLLTAAQNNITSATSLASVGVITVGRWQSTAVGTTYGGTGSNLGSATGSSNKLIATGTIESGYAASLIDGANSGYLLAAGGNGAAPSFVNTTNAAFSFASGTLTINNAAITTGTITGVPSNATDIVNKSYADSISGGLDVHASVRLTTISAIGGSYRQVGTAGTTWGNGDYIIATTPAELIGVAAGLDTPTSGIALTNGQRVLIKDGVLGGYASGSGAYSLFSSLTTYGGIAASYVANGIYTVASYGGAATSGWVLVRATDSDNGSGVQELTGGTFTFVEEGSTYADNAFVCTNDTTSYGAIGFGATQVTWSPFSGGAALQMGQGLAKTGNILATNFNITNDGNLVSGITYRGFTIGGARSSSVGSSSHSTFIVTSASAPSTNTLTANLTGFTLAAGQVNTTLTVGGVAAANTITGAADGFTIQGGTTARTLTVISGPITVANGVFNGGGFGLTLSSNGNLNLNEKTLAITAGTANITFTPSATTNTTYNLVSSASAQYVLTHATNTYTAGDMYYNSGTSFAAMTRLVFGSGAGSSVLIRSDTAPVWGTIQLGSANFVSGQLGLSNGGTNANLTAVNGGAVYSTGTALAITAAGTGGSVLVSTGNGAPVWNSIVLSSSNAVTGTLGISNGGTNSTATATAGGVSYGTGTAYAFTAAGTAGSVLVSTAAGAPVWNSIVLSSANAVTGTLGISNGGTNSTATATAGGISYGTGTAYAFTAAGTAGSVLVSTAAGAPVWNSITLSSANAVTGILGIANGGTNATSGNLATNGVVIYDGTRLTSGAAVGLTMTGGVGLSVIGTVQATGGFFVGGNSVLTGSATANQVAYYNAASTLTGSVGLVYNPTAASGVGLSLNVNATSGTILRVNSSAALTSGLLLDVDNNGTQAFSVDFKGMSTVAAASGNTALVITSGRTLLAAATANYASLGLNATGTDPSSPNVGDLWYNGTNLYFRKTGGTNFDLLVGSVSGSGTANKIAKWSTSSSLTDSNISDAGTGMTITSTSSIATAGSGATSLLTLQTLSGDNSLTDRYFVRGVTSAGTRLFSIDTAGNLRATTKSFDIPHPTKEGMRLVYGVLEGPEHGVYHRGTVEGKGVIQVNLPDYWHKLVGDQYTIQLTPWGNYNVSISSKTENYFTIQLVGDFISRKIKNIKVDYIVHGSRLDAPLDTEQ